MLAAQAHSRAMSLPLQRPPVRPALGSAKSRANAVGAEDAMALAPKEPEAALLIEHPAVAHAVPEAVAVPNLADSVRFRSVQILTLLTHQQIPAS